METEGSYYTWTRPEMARLLPERYHRVLEIGCGEGGFRSNLRRDAECWGIEPSEAGRRAAERLDRVLQGTYEAVADRLPDRHFDVVVCNDVIEHMADHEGFLRHVQQKMAPGACLVGSVPNVRYLKNLVDLLLRKDWQYQDVGGILDSTHLRFFTAKSLQRSLGKCGFSVETFQRLNPIWQRDTVRQSVTNLLCAVPAALVLGFDVMYVQFGFRSRIAAGGSGRDVAAS